MHCLRTIVQTRSLIYFINIQLRNLVFMEFLLLPYLILKMILLLLMGLAIDNSVDVGLLHLSRILNLV